MVRETCEVQLNDLMLTLGLIETIDKLAMANSVHWCGLELGKKDGHVLQMEFRMKVKGRKGGRRGHGRSR